MASAITCRHYNVNAGVPKTLIQHLIRWVVATGQFDRRRRRDADRHPRHRDLARAGAGEAGAKPQSTEEQVGPYALQDFNLSTRCATASAREDRLPRLARLAATRTRRLADGLPAGRAPRATISREITQWLRVFLRRFFGFSQFKRSALPNGPKVSAGGSLSPRGDWRAPSDGNARLWLQDIDSGRGRGSSLSCGGRAKRCPRRF